LRQYTREQFSVTPVCTLQDEKGPNHNKCFESEVSIAQRSLPSAWGANKKETEQKAAFNALVELGLLTEPVPHKDDYNVYQQERTASTIFTAPLFRVRFEIKLFSSCRPMHGAPPCVRWFFGYLGKKRLSHSL